jgi:hypothetical protein
MDDEQTPHVGPPELILQAIVPPTDAPVEIRAAVADALARRNPPGGPAHTWKDVSFAASAIALVEGTNQRDVPDTQWVFALSAQEPKVGQQVRSSGGWKLAIGARAFSDGTTRPLWRAVLFDSVRTEPRTQSQAS